MGDNIFEIQNLSVDVFDMARKPIIGAAPKLEILKDITFNIQHGDVIGIVGGSGSGKSTLGRAMLRLIEPSGGKKCWLRLSCCGTRPRVLWERGWF